MENKNSPAQPAMHGVVHHAGGRSVCLPLGAVLADVFLNEFPQLAWLASHKHTDTLTVAEDVERGQGLDTLSHCDLLGRCFCGAVELGKLHCWQLLCHLLQVRRNHLQPCTPQPWHI